LGSCARGGVGGEEEEDDHEDEEDDDYEKMGGCLCSLPLSVRTIVNDEGKECGRYWMWPGDTEVSRAKH
jgi:hypothetical protein